VLVLGIGSDDEEVIRGGDAAVAGAGGENEDISGLDGDGLATFAAEDEVGVTTGEAQDLVGGGMIVVEGVDPVAPLRRPSVGGKGALHVSGQVAVGFEHTSIEQNRKRAVGHPAVWLQMNLLRGDGRGF